MNQKQADLKQTYNDFQTIKARFARLASLVQTEADEVKKQVEETILPRVNALLIAAGTPDAPAATADLVAKSQGIAEAAKALADDLADLAR